MIDIKVIEGLCTAKGLTRIALSVNPSWIDKTNKLEGVELRNGMISSFWVKDMERVYGEPASDFITNAIIAIQNAFSETGYKPENEEPNSNCISICPSGLKELKGCCDKILGHDGQHTKTYIENEGQSNQLVLYTWWD